MANVYLQQLQIARQELAALLPQRMQLETKIAWLQSQIATLERLTGPPGDDQSVSLADVIQAVIERGGVSVGLTDSCRRVLQASNRPLRVREVVLILEHAGLPTNRYVDPSATVTTVLQRLVERGQARVAAISEEGRPLFVWQGAQERPSRGSASAAVRRKVGGPKRVNNQRKKSS